MVYESKPALALGDPGVISPRIDIKSIINGEEFFNLVRIVDILRTNKTSDKMMHEGCMQLSKSLRACFGIDTTIAVLSQTDSMGFFGYNIFPGPECLLEIITHLGNSEFAEIRHCWQKNRKWHIDIDGMMLYDTSNRLTSAEIVTLLLYSIEQVVFDYDTPIQIAYTISKFRTKMNVMSSYLADSPKFRFIYMIPFALGCSYTNFIYAEPKKNEFMKDNYMIGAVDASFIRYMKAVEKILLRYGRSEIVDQTQFDIERRIIYILNWIYEGLNDIRHSFARVNENLKRHMVACRSPYVRTLFKRITLHLNQTTPARGFIGESFGPNANVEMNPDMEAMIAKQKDEYYRKYVATIESKISSEFLDKNGNCKKVTQEDLDIIRVEAEGIESIDDKIYLLEKLYKYMGAIDCALDMLETGNAKKVKQTKNQLLALKDHAADTRQYILRYKIQPSRYGLYIKYPAGYEG